MVKPLKLNSTVGSKHADPPTGSQDFHARRHCRIAYGNRAPSRWDGGQFFAIGGN